MGKNPFGNALAAEIYIGVVVGLMNFGSKYGPEMNPILGPIALISLFTLSAAVMGYLFCYHPGQMYFEGKKKEAIRWFLQTVTIFAGFTIVALGLLFSGLIK